MPKATHPVCAGCPLASVDVTGVSAAQIRGCAADLGRVVRNLVDNAARHCRSGYAVTLGERAGRAVLTVTDDGEGVATALAERIFERFARSDDARSRANGGTGLGLAIVRAIVEDHGGHVVLNVAHRGGARFVVDLPLAAG